MRSGTLNVPGIVGFGRAAEICANEAAAESARLRRLRDRLWNGLKSERLRVNGSMEQRLPQNLNVCVDGVHGETVLKSLANDVAVPSGAACATARADPSHVLKVLGLTNDQSRASLRFGLARFNTEEEVDRVIELVRCRLES